MPTDAFCEIRSSDINIYTKLHMSTIIIYMYVCILLHLRECHHGGRESGCDKDGMALF